jgi:hypothetical protein
MPPLSTHPGQEILLTAALRASPLYDLVLYDRLAAGEQAALAELVRDSGFYGVLRARDDSGPAAAAPRALKSVDRDTALLFLTLREPGPLPAYVRAQLGESAARMVARLVADGVLEVASGGGFLSGAAALAQLGGGNERMPGKGRIAELSAAALRYGQALGLGDPELLAWRLYSYNRQPLTPRWSRLLPTPAAMAQHLGIDAGGANRRLLDRDWEPAAMASWLAWYARPRAGEASGGRAGGPTWKLYVSPRPEGLAGGFAAVLAALTAARATQFKVGADATGLLRPDTIVAYFPSYERLAAAADAVLARLDGAPAQGVPFTAEIGGGGLLSWGVDPPDDVRSVLGGSRESWRVWVAHRLAWALLTARDVPDKASDKAAEASLEPWRFALERVRLEGVDTETWAPGAALWKEA